MGVYVRGAVGSVLDTASDIAEAGGRQAEQAARRRAEREAATARRRAEREARRRAQAALERMSADARVQLIAYIGRALAEARGPAHAFASLADEVYLPQVQQLVSAGTLRLSPRLSARQFARKLVLNAVMQQWNEMRPRIEAINVGGAAGRQVLQAFAGGLGVLRDTWEQLRVCQSDLMRTAAQLLALRAQLEDCQRRCRR
jgi:hypothetical protein